MKSEIKIWRVAASGHRPNKLFGYDLRHPSWIQLGNLMKNFILERLSHHPVVETISGMALGVDQLFGLVALKLRNEGRPIRLTAAIPCVGQEKPWKSKEYWQRLVDSADEVVYVSRQPYTPSCMQLRNQWMVDRADEVLAVWNGTSGGTASCLKYARAVGRPITNIFEGFDKKLG